ncbi:MAG TPA: hypothetical protein VHY32_06170 [Caulobacteraceae bacterium]|jgi:hypothetical protein|nr:hypothetical protein [Caulobacteraceae bacterium]
MSHALAAAGVELYPKVEHGFTFPSTRPMTNLPLALFERRLG